MSKPLTCLLLLFLIGCAEKAIHETAPANSADPTDREKIRAVVRQHMSEIKDCYEKALSKNPKLEGKIVVQWTIIPSGAVSEVHVKSSSLNSSAVEACSLSKIKNWRFPSPPPKSAAVVSYPFTFGR